ncbi:MULTISPECIES: hypothetical protein [unclassified Enterobacter]|uniref:hypothetical protein n=1 Tax=unclassified Enterobacter TaxID=2608935 RepID=UPI001619F8C0|nr:MULTISPECIES: hypothetical protein [unclassified Enterobacter]
MATISQESDFYSDAVQKSQMSHFTVSRPTDRLVTKLQILNDGYGFKLTYAILASLIKARLYSDLQKWDGVADLEVNAHLHHQQIDFKSRCFVTDS